MQLFVIQQVVVVLAVDKPQDVIDQRFVIIRINGAGGDLLYLAGGDMHLQPVFFRNGKRFVRQPVQYRCDFSRGQAHRLLGFFCGKLREGITFANPPDCHRAVQA